MTIPIRAAEEIIWQIGQFDRSSAEFRPWIEPSTGVRFDYAAPERDFHFQVGRSVISRDWPAYQPGTANGGAGFRAHPCTVEFVLTNPPPRSAALVLSLLAYSARLPILQVDVNGHRGWFYQRPLLEYSGGDTGVFFLPYYSAVDLTCELPAGWLTAGTNRVVLTALDEPGTRDDTRPAGFPWPGSSGIHYDALKLVQADSPPAGPSIRVEPTVFYERAEGGLCERIDVVIRGTEFKGPVTVEMDLGGRQVRQSYLVDRAFGEWRLEFLVPELAESTMASVVVRDGPQSWRFTAGVKPMKKWTVLVVPNVHLDVGYTDYPSKVAEIQSRILDRAVEWSETSDFQFTPDGFWCIEEFWNGRTERQRQRLLQAIRRGSISLPAVYCSPFTGFASLENLIRLLYPSWAFARQHGLPMDVALNTDVPSYSWSFASVLAASGVKAFVGASDAYRGPFLLYNRFHEHSPHWWEGPDGGRVLTWYSRHYHQLASLFGLPPEMASGRDALPRFLQAYARDEYQADAVILYGSQAENGDLHPAHRQLVQDWNARYAFPALEFSGFSRALDRIVRQAGGPLPVLRGDGGPYWEDGLGADAFTTSLARQNMRRVLSAEKAATLASLSGPEIAPDRRALDDAWRNLLLIDEHTWHADSSVREPRGQQAMRQGAAKDARATEAQRRIDHVLERGLAALADEVRAPAGTVLVFNALSWRRSGWVELDVNRGFRARDLETAEWAPDEVLFAGNQIDHVRFYARDVPAMGYRCFALRPGHREDLGEISDGVLENRFYRLALDPATGRVLGLKDKETKAELVSSQSTVDFNQYIYVEGGDDLPNRLVQYSTVSPLPRLTLHSPQASRLLAARRTPLGLVAQIESSTVNTPRLLTEIVLPHEEKRVDIINRLNKAYTERKEAAYFAYPFAIDRPQFRYATQNGFVNPNVDLLPGASREWFCLQDWLAIDGPDFSVALALVDAPLVALGDIVRGAWPREFGERPARVFSYVMNNYTPEGYQAGQGGELVFRYRLTSAPALAPAALARFGAEAATPLEINEITRNDKATFDRGWLPGTKASFLQVDGEHVALVAWKSAERGTGTILRLLETGGLNGAIRLHWPFHRLSKAWLCSALEEDLQELSPEPDSLTLHVQPHSITTVRLELSRSSTTRADGR